MGEAFDHRDKITIDDAEIFLHDMARKEDGRGETLGRRTIIGTTICRPVMEFTKDSTHWPKARRFVLAFPSDIHHGVYSDEQFLKVARAMIRCVKRKQKEERENNEHYERVRADLAKTWREMAQIPDSISNELILNASNIDVHSLGYDKQKCVGMIRHRLGLPIEECIT